MRALHVSESIAFHLKMFWTLLLVGAPGIGKTELVKEGAKQAGYRILIAHPVVDDPINYKGMPFLVEVGEEVTARFMPIGQLKEILSTEEPTLFFLDDLGQAPASVQSACMQLLLERRIDEHPVSDKVVFMSATNRREDKANVSGILEPVKSRFRTIIHVDVHLEDWMKWAQRPTVNMPPDLMSYLRWKPNMLHDFKATKDLKNSPSPRTIQFVGDYINAGLAPHLEFETFAGTVGEVFATEFTAFRRMYKQLPNVNLILKDPNSVPVPEKADVTFALMGALGHKADKKNIGNVVKFIEKLEGEFQVYAIRDIVNRDSSLISTPAIIKWVEKHSNFIA
jgi:hypothetical protein